MYLPRLGYLVFPVRADTWFNYVQVGKVREQLGKLVNKVRVCWDRVLHTHA